MALHSNTQIFIGGVPILAYKRLTLHQEIDTHHVLILECRMDVLEEISGEIASEAKSFLGEVMMLKISALDTITEYKELEFKGIVTSVNNAKAFHHRDGDTVSIQAHSCSIIADDGAHITSYQDIDLSEILERTFQGYDRSKLETNFQPQRQEHIHYTVQHDESAFAYASRLAAQYSEWFYYDGKELIFGKPEDEEPLELQYGHDLQEFSLDLMPAPNNFKYFTNDYLTDEQYEIASSDISSGVNGFNGYTSTKSQEMYTKETAVFVNSYYDIELRQRLDQYAIQQKKAKEAGQVLVKGVSDNPGVKLGQIVEIKDNDSHYGSFRITSVSHVSSENGKYQNRFTGITKEMDVYPNTDLKAFPKSDSQVALVKENADPDKLGRIKVQFPWQQATGEMTPWLRMLAPHAGGDKGFHFIPEIGEEVLIGFEGGNAERPYVLGALYNGNQKPENWHTENNDIKAIRTRSGHTIELNDAQGSESITLTDKNSNVFHIDTSKNNITITAGENMTLNAKNMQINVEENLDITVGEDHNLNSKNSNEYIDEDKTIDVTQSFAQTSSEVTIIASNGDMTIEGAGVSTFQGGSDVKISKG